MAGLLQMRRHGFIGGQHELFDDPVAMLRGLRVTMPVMVPPFVEFDQRLGQIEIDRAALVALALQDLASSRISSKRSPAAHSVRCAGSPSSSRCTLV
jgi:hypothetical protein